MNLMDADLCIDLLRSFPPAVAWLAAQTEEIGISCFVAMELVLGCRNGRELRVLETFLADYPMVFPSEAEMRRAALEYAPLHLSHGLGGFDALIAATAVGGGHTLLTFNTKHFRAVPGLITAQPYTR